MTGAGVSDGDAARLERLLGVADIAWLLARVRLRMVGSGREPLQGVVQLDDPTEAQRTAVTRLVGRPRRPGATLRVDLADVEAILRRGPWPAGLADAVETLTGPVVDRAAERAEEAGAWARAQRGLADARDRFPDLDAWWVSWCASGGLKRATRAEASRTRATYGPAVAADLVDRLAVLLAALPVQDEPLPVLARRTTGDAHALDSTRPLGRLAAAAVEAAFASGGGSRRETWAVVGVVLSNVASTVLCLGVSGTSLTSGLSGTSAVGGALARASAAALKAMREARTPLVLTLDQVRSGGVEALSPERLVHVCENPTIVEVVAQRWARATTTTADPVLVCTWGQPSTAVVDLLGVLTSRGARCAYHGDFDWPGLRIAESLRQRVPWTPWRYTAEDYLAAIDRGAPALALDGPPAPASWDPRLAVAMSEHGLAVEEEAVSEVLARDLVDDSSRT